jgi:hypothetical protein
LKGKKNKTKEKIKQMKIIKVSEKAEWQKRNMLTITLFREMLIIRGD